MKNIKSLFLLASITMLFGCSSNDDIPAETTSITINFSHFWDGVALETSDFGTTTLTNADNVDLIINDVRYVISDIKLTHVSGEVTNLKEYNLVDVDDETGLSFTTSASILPGEYSNISFRVGFSEEDNISLEYQDLTSVNFDVGAPLGGGYHYMQMDGTYIDPTTSQSLPFNYHFISAFNNGSVNPVREDTSFEIDLGAVSVQGNTNINVGVDFAGWFNSPDIWLLDVWNILLMQNYQAQLAMSNQGRTGVFSLIDILQQ